MCVQTVCVCGHGCVFTGAKIPACSMRIKHMFTFYAIIDFMSVFPFYLDLVIIWNMTQHVYMDVYIWENIYVCLYVCIFVCIYERMYKYMYISIYVCMYVCMYACMYVCMYACMYSIVNFMPVFPFYLEMVCPERYDVACAYSYMYLSVYACNACLPLSISCQCFHSTWIWSLWDIWDMMQHACAYLSMYARI